jgi:hypothetical protein
MLLQRERWQLNISFSNIAAYNESLHGFRAADMQVKLVPVPAGGSLHWVLSTHTNCLSLQSPVALHANYLTCFSFSPHGACSLPSINGA